MIVSWMTTNRCNLKCSHFYTMVHARSEAEFTQILEDLKKAIGPVRYCSLRTCRELKKTAMKYFV